MTEMTTEGCPTIGVEGAERGRGTTASPSPTPLDLAIERGKAAGKTALYFGCWDRPGHYLHDRRGHTIWDKPTDLYWGGVHMDTGLLKNGKHEDRPDGRVWWNCGGLTFWYAFVWWDRSVDRRGGCNSGFYVRGFGFPEVQEAFDYACAEFPKIVSRQVFPLVLQNPNPQRIHDDTAPGRADK